MDVSGRKTESIPPTLAEEVAKRLFSLLIHHQDGAQIVSLVPGARLLLGRAAEADISIPEPTLSRQHCRIEVIGDEVWIEDLDSSNGTRVNGAPVQRCRLRPGDDVALGGTVTLSVHAPANHVQGLEHHSRFAATLEEELMRSATLHHELAVLVVSAATGDPPYGEWCPQIRQVLRPVDRVALHSAGVVEILLPESDRGRSLQLAERILGIGQALRCGVALFPGAADDAKQLLEAALDALRQTTEGQPVVAVPPPSLWPEGRAEPELDEDPPVVGQAMQPVFETAGRVAQSDLPVLLVGETGSGKEVVAREIHSLGPRAKGPLCCVNCGGMPRDLVQSILFGHERGSFTGANQQKNGLFHEADGGTLLLDEVGELPAEAQVALLRVLETGRVIRLGSTRELPVDVRVISATHRNLEAMCEAGTFRWDLFYRLNTITLKLPPLRQRKDEIRPLAERFVARATRIGRLAPKRIDESVFAVLERYQWPGNVRELRNALERAALVSAHPVITVADLPDRVRAAVDATVCDGSGRVVMQRSDPTPCPIPPREDESPFKRKVLAYEISLIRGALQRTGWNKTAAARELQMPLRTLMHKIQVYGLSQPEEVEQSARIELDLESEEVDFKSLVRRYETKLLLDALGDCGWNKAEAARRLGLPLSTVLYKIKTYQLEDPTG
jgi:DNA-binding NtrC family response regulator